MSDDHDDIDLAVIRLVLMDCNDDHDEVAKRLKGLGTKQRIRDVLEGAEVGIDKLDRGIRDTQIRLVARSVLADIRTEQREEPRKNALRTAIGKGKVREEIRPLFEALDDLKEVTRYDIAMWLGHRDGWQAAGAKAVQALTECTRQLRDIAAEFFPVEDDEDDDKAESP